jgi:hypothetical protein
MTNIQMGLALVGVSFGMVAMGIYLAWCYNELPRQRYQEYLSELTKHGSNSSGSAPD